MEDIRTIKQRFEIIGNDIKLNRAIEKAVQVAPTDFTVLITGESGVGKEIFLRISTVSAPVNMHSTSRLTAGGFRKEPLIPNYSATRKVHSQGRFPTGKVTSRSVTGERFFWMKWENYLYPRRRNCYAYLRPESLSGSDRRKCKKRTCE